MSSDKLFELLRKHEGVKQFAYQCSAGKTTIGVGRNIDEDGGIGLCDVEIDFLLSNDIDRVETELESTFSWYKNLNLARKDAMVSIAFNLGLTRLLKFEKALGFMAGGDYIMAGMEFDNSLWSKQVGARAEELCQMIETGSIKMPLLNVSPPAGVVKNGTALQQANTWSDANLVRWYEGAMQPIGGWRKRTTAAMDGVCRAIISYLDNGRNRRTVAGTHTKLYFIGEDNTLTDITPSGFTTGNANAVQNLGYGGLTWNASTWNTPRPDSGAYTPASTWSLDTFGEYVIACATSDGKIYQWANSTGTPAALLSNAPTSTTAIVVSEERFVFALGAGGVGNKVAFSDQEQSNVWAPAATNQAGSFTLATNGNLMAGVRMRGETLLLTDIDAHTARYQGPPFVYGFRQAGTGCGVISANGCAVADGTAYWMGNNGFYSYNGSVQSMRSSVGDFIFSHLNTTERSKVFAVVNSQFSEVVWFYPSAGTTENDSYVSYNYRENHWQIGKVARTAGFDIGAFVFPNYVSSEATGSYVYEHEVGNTYDTDSDVFAETGPMQIGVGDRMMVATSLIPDEQTQGDVTATFKTRTYPNSAESSFGPFDMANPTSVRFQGRQVQMRVTGDQPTSWRVGNMRLEVVAGSRR